MAHEKQFQKIKSNSEWEDKVGFSRAVKAGNHIFVSGTTALGANGKIIGEDDVYAQSRQCILNIEKALNKAGATLQDVVRTRAFITNMDEWEAFGKAHREFFINIEPAATLVEINKLIHPDMLIEIEAEAVIT
ncbi:MAG: RidA family protein [Balneolaceae bacterium]